MITEDKAKIISQTFANLASRGDFEGIQKYKELLIAQLDEEHHKAINIISCGALSAANTGLIIKKFADISQSEAVQEKADLRYCLRESHNAGGFDRAPVKVITALGIAYENADCSMASLAECVIFRGCSNVPNNLPPFITIITRTADNG